MIPSHSLPLRLPAGLALAAALGIAAVSLPAPAVEPVAVRDIGLVLSGGGAKGAYEVGVWRALNDLGLANRVAAISGTSVGAINATAFASGISPDRIESIWKESLSGIFAIRDRWVRDNFEEWLQSAQADDSSRKWKTTTETTLQGAMSLGKLRFGSGPLEGAIDPRPLEKDLSDTIPAEWPKTAPVAFASAVARNGTAGPSLEVFRLNDADPSNRVAMVCASAAIPFAYPSRRVGKKYYLDGGTRISGFPGRLLNPAPLSSFPGIRTIIAVYLDDFSHLDPGDRLEPSDLPSNVRLVEIFPSENIGGAFGGWQGVFDASPEAAKRFIELGRSDARKKLKAAGLAE